MEKEIIIETIYKLVGDREKAERIYLDKDYRIIEDCSSMADVALPMAMRLSTLNTSEQAIPTMEVEKAKVMPPIIWGMLSMVLAASLTSNPPRPRMRPMKVPRMPRLVKSPGITSANCAWPEE